MRFHTSAAVALLIVLVSCQSSPRLTLYKAGSTPIDRKIAFDDCRSASLKTYRNKTDRAEYVKRCMASKGYAILEHIPICPTAEERQKALQYPQPRKASMMKCASGVALDQ